MSKGTDLTRDLIEKLRARDLKRMRLKDKDPRVNEQMDEIEEMTSRQIAVLEKITDEKIGEAAQGRRTASGRHQAGEVLYRDEAQAVGRR